MSTAPTTGTKNGDDVVIVGAARTPQGKLRGQLAPFTAVELGAAAIRGALQRAGIDPAVVEAVILVQVLQAGVGQNPARQAAIAAGIGWSAHTATVNKVCLSGLTAVIDAARLIRSGEADVVVAGGMESMTNALPPACEPRLGGRCLWRRGRPADRDHPQGRDRGRHRRGHPPRHHRRDPRQAAPGVHPGESITAGNASPISDGAAAVVLTTRAHAARQGWPVMATIRAAGQVAGPDTSLHPQPVRAIEAALKRQGWDAHDLDLIEIDEALGAVVAQSVAELGVDPTRVNPHGGGIAIGHPIGASGARLVVHAAHQLHTDGVHRAAVALCGGGQGEALLLGA